VLAPGGRDHGHEATAMGGDIGQVLVGAKLAIGHIEAFGTAGELAQALPGADVGRIVGGVPVVHVEDNRDRDWYDPIGGGRQDEQQLLEVRSEILVDPVSDPVSRVPPLGFAVDLGVLTGESDRRGVIT
jgi:hypothetical protein